MRKPADTSAPRERNDVAVGVDAGGTATRAHAVTVDGHVVGTARTSGGNPNSHPPEEAARAVRDAIAEATAGIGTGSVRACVVGMAGSSKLTDPAVRAVFDRTWGELELDPEVVSDAETAFASATAEPDGTVLVAGTGSIAGRIRARRMTATAGGYGWLLGDEGSGFWIGRQAVRVTLDSLTGAGLRAVDGTHGADELPALARAVLAEVDIDPAAPRAAHRLITAVNAVPPVRLARFAPLVSTACAEGDPTARDVVERAARSLVDTATACREHAERTPVVLVGSVLGAANPVGARVRELLRTEAPETAVLTSADGVLGAVWLAALRAFGPGVPPPVRET